MWMILPILFILSFPSLAGALFNAFLAPKSMAGPASAGLMARRVVDLHDSKAVFDFCGGLMFQLVLSDKLRSELLSRSDPDNQPIVFGPHISSFSQIPNYRQCSDAEQLTIFHGREVRGVKGAAGGMGYVLQLVSSLDDPEGWTKEEIQDYNGWKHDTGRKWRKAVDHDAEGNFGYKQRFGQSAYGLHHRFYWRLDNRKGLWLSAEDGCEGVIRDW